MSPPVLLIAMCFAAAVQVWILLYLGDVVATAEVRVNSRVAPSTWKSSSGVTLPKLP